VGTTPGRSVQVCRISGLERYKEVRKGSVSKREFICIKKRTGRVKNLRKAGILSMVRILPSLWTEGGVRPDGAPLGILEKPGIQ